MTYRVRDLVESWRTDPRIRRVAVAEKQVGADGPVIDPNWWRTTHPELIAKVERVLAARSPHVHQMPKQPFTGRVIWCAWCGDDMPQYGSGRTCGSECAWRYREWLRSRRSSQAAKRRARKLAPPSDVWASALRRARSRRRSAS